MPTPSISVVIPLYNKEREIGATLRSVLAQTLPPREIVVVDDGSTDRGAAAVQELAEKASQSPGAPAIQLLRQPNGGVSAARNRGIAAATGEYIALLDADDSWTPGFLAEIAVLIGEFPGCGLYCTGFDIVADDGLTPAPGPAGRGIVADFFRDSAHRYIAIPSTSCIPRRVFDTVGRFPEGMKMGEDLYMWIRIARRYPVCYSPARLARYSKVASNRSSAGYIPERTAYSFEELYDSAATDGEREFIARAALGRALVQSVKGDTRTAARTARFFARTRVYRSTLLKVRVLNALPIAWRAPLLGLYDRIAWKLARRGV